MDQELIGAGIFYIANVAVSKLTSACTGSRDERLLVKSSTSPQAF